MEENKIQGKNKNDSIAVKILTVKQRFNPNLNILRLLFDVEYLSVSFFKYVGIFIVIFVPHNHSDVMMNSEIV